VDLPRIPNKALLIVAPLELEKGGIQTNDPDPASTVFQRVRKIAGKDAIL